MPPESKIKRLYYSIGDVCEMLKIDAHVLRFWETEFKELSPKKNRGGKRIYRDADIDVIRTIMELLYERKYTIEGARQVLKNGKLTANVSNGIESETQETSDVDMRQLRKDLVELKKLIDNYIKKSSR